MYVLNLENTPFRFKTSPPLKIQPPHLCIYLAVMQLPVRAAVALTQNTVQLKSRPFGYSCASGISCTAADFDAVRLKLLMAKSVIPFTASVI